jgi:hypothetical protein
VPRSAITASPPLGGEDRAAPFHLRRRRLDPADALRLRLAVEVHGDKRLVPRHEPRDENGHLLRAIGNGHGPHRADHHRHRGELLCAEPAEGGVDHHLPHRSAKIDDEFPAHRAASLHVADQEPVERLGLLHEDVELCGLGPGGTGEPSDRQGKKGAHGPS